jgi:hypothetical protein
MLSSFGPDLLPPKPELFAFALGTFSLVGHEAGISLAE